MPDGQEEILEPLAALDREQQTPPQAELLDKLDRLQVATGMKFQSSRQQATQKFLKSLQKAVAKPFEAKEEEAQVSAPPPPASPEPEGPEESVDVVDPDQEALSASLEESAEESAGSEEVKDVLIDSS